MSPSLLNLFRFDDDYIRHHDDSTLHRKSTYYYIIPKKYVQLRYDGTVLSQDVVRGKFVISNGMRTVVADIAIDNSAYSPLRIIHLTTVGNILGGPEWIVIPEEYIRTALRICPLR